MNTITIIEDVPSISANTLDLNTVLVNLVAQIQQGVPGGMLLNPANNQQVGTWTSDAPTAAPAPAHPVAAAAPVAGAVAHPGVAPVAAGGTPVAGAVPAVAAVPQAVVSTYDVKVFSPNPQTPGDHYLSFHQQFSSQQTAGVGAPGFAPVGAPLVNNFPAV